MEAFTLSALVEERSADAREKLDAIRWKLEKSGAQWTNLPRRRRLGNANQKAWK